MAQPNPNAEKLREKLKAIRAGKSDEESKKALNEAVELMMSVPLILPVASKKEIHPDDETPEADNVPKLSPFTVTNKKGLKLFPFFTSVELMQKFFDFPVQTFLTLSIGEYLPLLKQAQDVSGLVIDPSEASYPFPTSFIDALYQRMTKQASQQQANQETKDNQAGKEEDDQENAKKLQQALADFRKNQDQDSYLKAAAALMNSAVFVPVYPPENQEVNPEPGKTQQMRPMLVAGKGQEERLFVFFTDYKQLTSFTKDAPILPLKMKFTDLVPMLENTMKAVKGFVIDPLGVNLVFDTRFIKQFNQAYGKQSGLQMKESKDLLETLSDPAEHNQDLEAALITGGFHIPEINRMFLKEQTDSKTGQVSWFVLVESDKHDPALFSQLAEMLGKTAGNREVGFMFITPAQAAQYAKEAMPIYARM